MGINRKKYDNELLRWEEKKLKIKNDGAKPNDTKSLKESSCFPNSESTFINLATAPSIPSNKKQTMTIKAEDIKLELKH